MKKMVAAIGSSFVLCILTYLIWLKTVNYEAPKINVLKPEVKLLTTLDCPTVLVGIQTELMAEDYRSEEAFYSKLLAHVQPLKELLKDTIHPILVFPEHIGTWLVVANESGAIYEAGSVTMGMMHLLASHPIAYFSALNNCSKVEDCFKASFFQMKAQQSKAIYERTFSRLAKEFQATIVAGSIVLPEPSVEEGHIRLGNAILYNTSFVFYPSGKVAAKPIKKAFPVLDEQGFCKAGQIEDIHSIGINKTEQLGVLICADSWFPDSYKRLKELNTTIVAVPSYSIGKDLMDLPWKGYNGFDAPEDVRKEDVLHLTEGEAWDKYALSGRIQHTDAPIGVNVFFRGTLWDMISDGKSKLVLHQQEHKLQTDGAGLLISCVPDVVQDTIILSQLN